MNLFRRGDGEGTLIGASPVSPFDAVCALARRQVEAASVGDFDLATRLLEDRQILLRGAVSAVTDAERSAIRETLELDRQLAGLFRERMLAIRAQAMGLERGRTALKGYGRAVALPPARLEARR